MKHQYEDYIEWIDDEVHYLYEEIADYEKAKGTRLYEPWRIKRLEKYVASLLANKATLERHKEATKGEYGLPACGDCVDFPNGFDAFPARFPCDTLLDVTNQLDEVMN